MCFLCLWPWSFLANGTLLDNIFNILVEWSLVSTIFGSKMALCDALVSFVDVVEHVTAWMLGLRLCRLLSLAYLQQTARLWRTSMVVSFGRSFIISGHPWIMTSFNPCRVMSLEVFCRSWSNFSLYQDQCVDWLLIVDVMNHLLTALIPACTLL